MTKGKGDGGTDCNEKSFAPCNRKWRRRCYTNQNLSLDEIRLDENGALVAPIEKGEVIGYLTYEYEGDDYGFIDPNQVAKVEVVVTESG